MVLIAWAVPVEEAAEAVNRIVVVAVLIAAVGRAANVTKYFRISKQ